MGNFSKLFKDYDESRAFKALVNIADFVDPQAFTTKSGEVGVALSIRGPDVECREPAYIDVMTASKVSALRALDERFIVNTFLLKRSRPILEDANSSNRIYAEAAKNRRVFLQSKEAALYSYEHFLTVLLRPEWRDPSLLNRLVSFGLHPINSLRRGFSVENQCRSLDSTVTASLRTLHLAVNSFLEQTSDHLEARVLGREEAFQFFRRLFNPDPVKAHAVHFSNLADLDYLVADSQLECHPDHLRWDNYFVKTLTLKQLPSHSFANMFSDLVKVKADLVITTEWNPLSSLRAVGLIRSHRRHFNNTKTSVFSQIGPEPPSEKDVLRDTAKEGMRDELGECLKAIEMKGVRLGEFSLTIVILAQSLEEAQRATAEVMKVVGVHDGAMNEERYNGLNAFLASLPGGHPYNLRKNLITDENYVDMILWFQPAEGERKNKFLRAGYLAAFETEDHSLYYYNPHVQDVAHKIVLGATGGGKSFLLNFLVTHAQQYDPYTLIFDVGGSFTWLTKLFDGASINFRADEQDFLIGPFQLEPTSANLEFLFAFTKLLVKSRGYQMSDSEERELFTGIRSLYVLDPEHRRLQTLCTTVPRSIGVHLKPWTEGEQYGRWFDNATDNVSYKRFQYINFEGMDRLGVVLEPLMFYLLHRANDIIYDESLATVFKLVVVDEAWLLLKDEVTRDYLTSGARTWRKNNTALILSTQSLGDLSGAQELRPLIDNCPTKLLLSNPTLDEAFYREVLRLNSVEIEKVRKLASKRQFLLKRDGLSKVLSLNVDPKSYWLFTTNPYEAKRRQEVVDQVGLEAALEILAGGSR